MSSYALLSEKTSRSDADDTDDATEDFEIEPALKPWHRIDGINGISKHWILIPASALLFLFSILLAVDIIIHTQSCHPDTGTQACRNVTRTYGLDFDYMSLDPKYDYLWDSELAGNNGIIELPPYANDTQREPGRILASITETTSTGRIAFITSEKRLSVLRMIP
jgi:hypothetical protein